MPKKNTAVPALATAPVAPPLSQFKHLVSTMAVAARSEAILAADPAPEISPAIQSAWNRLASPQRVAALALNHQQEQFVRDSYGSEKVTLNQQLFPLLSESDCETLAAGLRQCAADIQTAAASPAFERAAKLHSALVISPGGDASAPILAYPLMGLALRPAKVVIDGKRYDSLSASWLAQAGDAAISYSTANKQQRVGVVSPSLWIGNADLSDTARAEATAALDIAREVMPDDARTNEFKVYRFAAVLAAAPGTAALSGEAPLPGTHHLKNALTDDARHFNSARLGVGSEDLSKSAMARVKANSTVNALGDLSQSALSLALSRSRQDRTLGSELTGPLLLRGGPANQALALVKAAAGESQHYHSELTSSLLIDKSFYSRGYHIRHDLEKTLASQSDADLDRYLLSIVKKLSGSDTVDFEPVGGRGRGMTGLSNALLQADARVGLIQWSESAMTGASPWFRRQARQAQDAKDGRPWALSDKSVLEDALSPARSGLIEAAQAIELARKNAQARFIQTALAEAERVESAWLEQRGMLTPWRQALIAGPVNSQTLAWAVANPASGFLISDDPLVNLGARCAKAWGLRVDETLGAAHFSERIEAALSEMGAGKKALDALRQSSALRDQVAALSRVISEPDAQAKDLARSGLEFTLRLAQRAALLGLPAHEIALLCDAYAGPERQLGPTDNARAAKYSPQHDLSHFALSSFQWDGFGPRLGSALIHDADSARLAQALNLGKAAHYDSFLDALSQDWIETQQARVTAGGSADEAQELAKKRAYELVSLYPKTNEQSLDWRKPLFDAPAWSVLGSVSPRFSAALLAASSQGPLGAWCSQAARRLGINDAADGNDLIGKTREAVKAATGLSDGAWKQMIKTPESLLMLADAMGLSKTQYSSNPKAIAVSGQSIVALPQADQAILSQTTRFAEANLSGETARSTARLFSAAAQMNIPMPSAIAAGEALLRSSILFSSGLGQMRLEGAEGAQFYLKELEAKLDRAPYLIKEAAKRFEKFQRDALTPPPEGEVALDPLNALKEEVLDLADWVGNSEPGLWQTLPAQPTWGQLRRASGEWHAEQAAMAQDKLERQIAKAQRDQAANQARREQAKHAPAVSRNESKRIESESQFSSKSVPVFPKKLMGHFENATGSGWPKIVGKHSRDGWQAVELLTADALLAEGAAMSHCVSSYSGQCRAGDTRIFSILLNDERVCTLQISPDSGNLGNSKEDATFRVIQNKGKANKSITSKAALDFCDETLATVHSSWKALCQKQTALRAAAIAEAARVEEARKAAQKRYLLGEETSENAQTPASASPLPSEPGVGEKLKARRSAKSVKADLGSPAL